MRILRPLLTAAALGLAAVVALPGQADAHNGYGYGGGYGYRGGYGGGYGRAYYAPPPPPPVYYRPWHHHRPHWGGGYGGYGYGHRGWYR